MMDGVEVKYDEKYGYGLYATRDFEKGEIVLSEEPFITVAHTQSSKRDRAFACTFEIDLSVFLTFKTFFDASPEIQNSLLNDFYLPPQNELDSAWSTIGSAYLDRIIKICIKRVEAWADIPEETFRKVFMVFTLNSRSLDLDTDGSAIFALGSKMNHSCEANTFYQSVDCQRGVHTVVKRITKGEQITTDYLGKDSILSRGARHKILQRTKLFTCECPRCTEKIDVSRGLPCPNCNTQINRRTNGGYIYWHPILSTNENKTSMTQNYWLCDMCNSRFEDNSPRLQGLFVREADLEKQVITLEEKLSFLPFINRSQLIDLYNACLVQLGTRHWTYIIILKTLILFDASNSQLQSKNAIIQNLDGVLNWYEKYGFDTPRYLSIFVLRVANVLIHGGEYANGSFFLERIFDEDFEYSNTFVQDYKDALDLMSKCRTVLEHTSLQNSVVTSQIHMNQQPLKIV